MKPKTIPKLFLSDTCNYDLYIFIYWVLRRFQHCTGHITTGSWKGRGNQYIQFVRVLYCKLLTNGKQLPAFPLEAVSGIEPQPQRWEGRVLTILSWWADGGPLVAKPNALLNSICFDRP